MKQLKLLLATLCCTTILLTSCTQQGGGITSTDDSLKIATTYFNNHPEKNKLVLEWGPGVKGSTPLTPDEVLNYAKGYDANQQIVNKKGESLKGFTLGNVGFSGFKANPNVDALFMRFAKNPKNEFTIMVVGLDKNGNWIQNLDSASNIMGRAADDPGKKGGFDNTETCPTNCPL